MTQPLPQSQCSPGPWRYLTIPALLAAVGFFVWFAIPYLLMREDVLERFDGRTAWIVSHVAFGSIALLVGPIQLWMAASGSTGPLHRKLGYVYLLSIAVSCTAAFYLAATTEVSWIFGAGLGGLAVAWTITTGLAYLAVMRRRFDQHREWMIRSYVVTLGFVFFRGFVGATSAMELGTLFERLNAASWFCWALPLLLTEAVIQGRKLFLPAGGVA